jgi:hypothetical protein
VNGSTLLSEWLHSKVSETYPFMLAQAALSTASMLNSLFNPTTSTPVLCATFNNFQPTIAGCQTNLTALELHNTTAMQQLSSQPSDLHSQSTTVQPKPFPFPTQQTDSNIMYA